MGLEIMQDSCFETISTARTLDTNDNKPLKRLDEFGIFNLLSNHYEINWTALEWDWPHPKLEPNKINSNRSPNWVRKKWKTKIKKLAFFFFILFCFFFLIANMRPVEVEKENSQTLPRKHKAEKSSIGYRIN